MAGLSRAQNAGGVRQNSCVRGADGLVLHVHAHVSAQVHKVSFPLATQVVMASHVHVHHVMLLVFYQVLMSECHLPKLNVL